MIISFAWTTNAVLADRKKRTRRFWSDEYAKRFVCGSSHKGYNRLPRVHGHHIGTVTITEAPYRQLTSLMTEEDYELEGLKYMEEMGLFIPARTVDGKRLLPMHPKRFFDEWREANECPFVINFNFIPLTELFDE